MHFCFSVNLFALSHLETLTSSLCLDELEEVNGNERYKKESAFVMAAAKNERQTDCAAFRFLGTHLTTPNGSGLPERETNISQC
jgi:hypothetical protein